MITMKREYHRRSDNERIAELQAKVESLKDKLEQKKRQDSPVIREIPKIKRRLLKFAQVAVDHGRQDLSNSTMAFLAGLERATGEEEVVRRRARQDA